MTQRLLWTVPITLTAMTAVSLGASSSDSLQDYSSLTLQELSAIKITSVSKKQEKLSQVSSAVYVLTREEIHRSGMTNVADLLRLVPGLSVARLDGSKWAVASRGFNGRFANKLLVLVDGRSIYSPLFGGVYWDMSMPPLDTIDRIEVIRGTGAAVWGANAVSGVVNIITRNASDIHGLEVTTSAGSEERGSVQVQAGGRMGGGVHYRAYGAATDRTALQTSDGQDAQDGWSDARGGFRIDGTTQRSAWELEGDLFHNSRGEVSTLATPDNHFSNAPRYASVSGNAGDLAFEWKRRISDTSDLRINASYDYSSRPEIGIAENTAGIGGIEVQYHFTVGKYHDVSLGLGDRAISESIVGEGLLAFHPSSMTYQTASTFAQDEIHLLNDRLLLTAGVKIEHDVMGGWQTQPTARALWAPTPKHSAWVSASRAVRTPTFYELSAAVEGATTAPSARTFGNPVVLSLNGSANFQSEIAKDYELGYRAQLSAKLSIDLAGFYTHCDDRRTATPGNLTIVQGPTPYFLLPYFFTNFGTAHSEGGEAAVTYHPLPAWKFAASYGYLNVHQVLGAAAPPQTTPGFPAAAPAHQVKLQSYWNLSKSVQLDIHLFCSTSFSALEYIVNTVTIPVHLRADVRLGWRVKPRWELTLVGQDLGSRHILELTPEALSPPAYTGRGFYLKSTWRY